MSTKRSETPYRLRRTWTEDDYSLIQSEDMSTAEIARALGVSTSTVSRVRRQLDSGETHAANRFTAEEDDLIRQHGPSMSARQLGRLLGRSWQSISDRRRKLGVPTVKNFDPQRPGARPLVAKTCFECGLLLQADWFPKYPSRRKWGQRCKKCTSSYVSRQPGYARYHAKRATPSGSPWVAEVQAFTLERAARRGQPYTESDMQVLADPDKTCLEKALELGRTYSGVSTAVAAYGYQSLVGVGQPERDQWIIDNPNAARIAHVRLDRRVAP